MPDKYPTCVNCSGRIQKINFALGPEWRHWPTPHGNYRTNELYRYCRTAALVATPKPADLVQGDAKLRENSGDADATENHTNGGSDA